MAINDADVQASASAGRASSRTTRFWNWKLIGVEIILAALWAYEFLIRAPPLPAVAGFATGLLGFWLLSSEFRGVAISTRVISFPSGRPAKLPILSFKRRLSISPASVRELTVMQPWCSFQTVEIYGGFGSELLLFQSRDQRLRFMTAIEEICPNVRMFRRNPPPRE